MTSVSVDRAKCVGCRLCESSCPECFAVLEDGIAVVKGEKCGTCDLKEVANGCPVSAITIEA